MNEESPLQYGEMYCHNCNSEGQVHNTIDLYVKPDCVKGQL